jgi:serine beta-lactamase-like protein LACTB, mitochondrial
MNRASRWFAILLCGIAIFGVDGAVRAAAPASAACVRTGSLGMLRAGLVRQVATAAPAAPVDPDYRKEIEQAQKIAQRIYDEGLEPGAKELKGKKIRPSGFAVAVAVNGKLVWTQGYGYADLEQNVQVTPGTRMRIGSVSKPLTATAVALLRQQGKLDIDAPVQRYVPGFPDKGAVITTREIGGHVAGIRHYKEKEFETCAHYNNVVDALDIFKNDPLVAPPGTKFSYSSYGFNLISAVVQKASGEDFLTYMHDKVFVPLGMNETVADEEDTLVRNRARFYDYQNDGTYRNAALTDNSYKWAGGGFLSTPRDLVKFGSALLHPGLLNQESLALLFTPQHTTDGKPTPYGFGWFIHDKPGETRVYEHSGGATGGSAKLMLYPEQGVVFAWTMNTTGFDSSPLEEIGKVFVKSAGGAK